MITAVRFEEKLPTDDYVTITSWRGFLVGGLAVMAAYFALPDTDRVAAAGSTVFAYSAAVAVIVGVRRHRPANPWTWYLIAAALLAIGTGDVVLLVSPCRTWPTSASWPPMSP